MLRTLGEPARAGAPARTVAVIVMLLLVLCPLMVALAPVVAPVNLRVGARRYSLSFYRTAGGVPQGLTMSRAALDTRVVTVRIGEWLWTGWDVSPEAQRLEPLLRQLVRTAPGFRTGSRFGPPPGPSNTPPLRGYLLAPSRRRTRIVLR